MTNMRSVSNRCFLFVKVKPRFNFLPETGFYKVFFHPGLFVYKNWDFSNVLLLWISATSFFCGFEQRPTFLGKRTVSFKLFIVPEFYLQLQVLTLQHSWKKVILTPGSWFLGPEYFFKFSGVFFRIYRSIFFNLPEYFSEFCWSIFPNFSTKIMWGPFLRSH